jgi:hypothetical protein
MEVTNAMVRAAIRKAVESGILPRNAAQNEYDWEIMRGILSAALRQEVSGADAPVLLRERKLDGW